MRRPRRPAVASFASLAILLAVAAVTVLAAAVASMAVAAPSPPRADPPAQAAPPAQPAANAAQPEGEDAARNRALAESEYKKGYKDAEEAKKLKAAGKAPEAKERFTKALKHFEEAVKIHDAYAEGWNMVGFCRRNLGDLRRAFDAYDRSLALNPDYEEAHEYLGELYAMQGMLEKAKEHLAWLTARKSDEAEELAEAIEAAEKAKAKRGGAAATENATASAAPTGAAPADSAGADSTTAR